MKRKSPPSRRRPEGLKGYNVGHHNTTKRSALQSSAKSENETDLLVENRARLKQLLKSTNDRTPTPIAQLWAIFDEAAIKREREEGLRAANSPRGLDGYRDEHGLPFGSAAMVYSEVVYELLMRGISQTAIDARRNRVLANLAEIAMPTIQAPRPIENGKFCEQIVSEMKMIRDEVQDKGKSIAQVEQERPNLAAWKVRSQLTEQEDKDLFNSPRQWESAVLQAETVLAKLYNKSISTIRSWRKAYKADLKASKSS